MQTVQIILLVDNIAIFKLLDTQIAFEWGDFRF